MIWYLQDLFCSSSLCLYRYDLKILSRSKRSKTSQNILSIYQSISLSIYLPIAELLASAVGNNFDTCTCIRVKTLKLLNVIYTQCSSTDFDSIISHLLWTDHRLWKSNRFPSQEGLIWCSYIDRTVTSLSISEWTVSSLSISEWTVTSLSISEWTVTRGEFIRKALSCCDL